MIYFSLKLKPKNPQNFIGKMFENLDISLAFVVQLLISPLNENWTK